MPRAPFADPARMSLGWASLPRVVAALQQASFALMPAVCIGVMVGLFGALSAACADDASPLDVQQLAPGVFAHQGLVEPMTLGNRGNISNLGFIVGSRAVAVIDCGGSVEEARGLIGAIRKQTPLPIAYVIVTHMHPDHVFGAAAFLRPDVAFVGHAKLQAALDARFEHYVAANRPALTPAAAAELAPIRIDRPVEDEMRLDLGDRELILKAWPVAHTDNDLTVFDPASGILFTGDLVFLDHLPAIDGSLVGWQKVMSAMQQLPATRIVPGHGQIGAPWPAAAEPEMRYFDRLATDLRAAIAHGDTIQTAVAGAAQSEKDKWKLFDDFNARNATTAFAELEWE